MAIEKTRGIVMRAMKYRETSLICDIFTRELGMRSYIAQGVRKQKSKMGAGFFQVMQPLSLVVYDAPGGGLNKIKELSADSFFARLHTDIPRSAVGLFLIELARKSIRETSPNPELYDFLENSLQLIDRHEGSLSLLPLWLGFQMCSYLGFAPHLAQGTYSEGYFDLRDGVQLADRPDHPDFLPPAMTQKMGDIIHANREEIGRMKMSRTERDWLFEKLIQYYQLHIDQLGKLRSPDIFRDLF